MKRTPLNRKTPMPPGTSSLARGSGLSRGSGIARRSAPIARKPLLAKPHFRTPAETEARRIVAERSENLCEIGRLCSGGAFATDWAHRVRRGPGPWDAANGMHACALDHAWCHAHPKEARAHGWILRTTDDFRTFPVFHALHGWCVLDSTGGWHRTYERPSL